VDGVVLVGGWLFVTAIAAAVWCTRILLKNDTSRR